MVKWPVTTFEKLYEIPSRNGLSKPSRVRGSGYKMINMGELFANDRIYDINMELVPLTDIEKEKAKILPFDLLFARQSLVAAGAGKCSIVMETSDLTVFESHLIRVRLNKLIADPFFYYYYFRSSCSPMQTIIQHCVQAGIKASDLSKLEVVVPPLCAQRKISSVLMSIDKKIEENKKINKNLEQQAVAVFNKFYDASTNQQPFTTLINVLGGGTPKTGNPEFWDGSIPFFTPKDVGTPYTFKTEKYITELGLKHCNSRLYPTNTTFVTARGTVGKISLAGAPMAMNQSCYALTSEIVDPLLVYFYVLKAVNALKHKASGAVFDAIVTRDFDGEIINILSDADSEAALSIIKPMMEAIYNNSKENMRLSAVRDTLLPKLMSGEIDVSNVDL